jgi:hypothetical protein
MYESPFQVHLVCGVCAQGEDAAERLAHMLRAAQPPSPLVTPHHTNATHTDPLRLGHCLPKRRGLLLHAEGT